MKGGTASILQRKVLSRILGYSIRVCALNILGFYVLNIIFSSELHIFASEMDISRWSF